MRNIFQALFGKRDAVNTASPTLALDLPFEMLAVPGAEALVVRDQLRAKGGLTPVILGTQEDVQLLVEVASSAGQTPEQIIDEATRIDVAAWLALRRQDDPDVYGTQLGDWPEEAPAAPGLSVHLDPQTHCLQPPLRRTLPRRRAAMGRHCRISRPSPSTTARRW